MATPGLAAHKGSTGQKRDTMAAREGSQRNTTARVKRVKKIAMKICLKMSQHSSSLGR